MKKGQVQHNTTKLAHQFRSMQFNDKLPKHLMKYENNYAHNQTAERAEVSSAFHVSMLTCTIGSAETPKTQVMTPNSSLAFATPWVCGS
jgi:hypothetical protein